MDGRQEKSICGLICAAAVLVSAAAFAETGPEKVDFYCNTVEAARASTDEDAYSLLLDAKYCGTLLRITVFRHTGIFVTWKQWRGLKKQFGPYLLGTDLAFIR